MSKAPRPDGIPCKPRAVLPELVVEACDGDVSVSPLPQQSAEDSMLAVNSTIVELSTHIDERY